MANLPYSDDQRKQTSRLDTRATKGAQFDGQRVPRMADVYGMLQGHPERLMYVGIKNVDMDQLARETGQAGVTRQLILVSMDHAVIRRWTVLAPESSTLHGMGRTEQKLAARLKDLRKTNFADGGITPSPQFLMEAGRELHAHRILFQAFANDAAGFATDSPDLARNAIREHCEKWPAKTRKTL